MATPEHEAKARKKLDAKKWSAFVARQTGDAAGPASPLAGVCLLAGMPGDASIAAFLTKRGFKMTRDAAAFVELCVKMNSTASRKRHLVLAKKASESDAHVAARLAAMLMGAHFAEAKDFNKNGRACGLKYHVRFNKKEGPVFHAAVSVAMAARLPSVLAVLRYTATRPGSRIELLGEKALRKEFKAAQRTDAEAWTSRRCSFTEEERRDAPDKLRPLHATTVDLLHAFEDVVAPRSACPGFPNA